MTTISRSSAVPTEDWGRCYPLHVWSIAPQGPLGPTSVLPIADFARKTTYDVLQTVLRTYGDNTSFLGTYFNSAQEEENIRA